MYFNFGCIISGEYQDLLSVAVKIERDTTTNVKVMMIHFKSLLKFSDYALNKFFIIGRRTLKWLSELKEPPCITDLLFQIDLGSLN